jgi:hypothetical protein
MRDNPALAVEPVEPRAWDEVIRAFPDRTVFHTMPWLRTVAGAHHLTIGLWQARSNDRTVAVWPYLRLRKGLLPVIGSPLPGWSTTYLGPLFGLEADIPAATQAFLGHRAFRGNVYFACKVVDRRRPVNLAPFGFKVVLKYQTYRLSLARPEESLWARCRRECRNHIRKAQKLGVEIREETSPGFIDDFWRMSLETFAKAGVQPTYSRRFIERVWAHVVPAGAGHFLSAFHEGRRVATILLLADDQAMYYWGGASHRAYRHLSANNLLQWHAINLARRLGLQTYDFISTTGGPGTFKQSFGPELVDMATHWERSPSRLFGAIKHRYERYLRRRRQLAAPIPAAATTAEPAQG